MPDLTGTLPVIDYARHPDYQLEPDPGLGRRGMELLEPLIERAREVETRRQATFGYRYGFRDSLGKQLVRDGSVQMQIPDSAMDAISAGAAPLLDTVAGRIGAIRASGRQPSFGERMQAADPVASAPLWLAVEGSLRDLGVHDLLRAYYAAPGSKIRNMAAIISSPEDAEVRFGAGEDGPSPTVGLHVDSSGTCILKLVLYLRDVDEGGGPFGMVPGSHLWGQGGEERIRRRAFDKSPLVSRGHKSRRTFVSLPKELQVKAEFGGDLLPGSEEAADLVARERVTVGGRGRFTLFDPEAIHRGGMALRSERRALLITLGARYLREDFTPGLPKH